MNDETFSICGALDALNKRLKSVEGKVPDYTADMLEVYRNLGVLTKRIEALEDHIATLNEQIIGILDLLLKKGENDE